MHEQQISGLTVIFTKDWGVRGRRISRLRRQGKALRFGTCDAPLMEQIDGDEADLLSHLP